MTRSTTRGIAVLGAALLIAVAIGACGGGGSQSSSSSTAAAAPAANAAGSSGPSGPGSAGRSALAACLKKYGVTLPNGPLGGRSGFATGRFGATGRPFGATGNFRPFGSTGASGATGARRRVLGGLASNSKALAAFAKCRGVAGGFGGG